MKLNWVWGYQAHNGIGEYVLQLGAIEARADDPQEAWQLLRRRCETAVFKGEVPEVYLYGKDVSAMWSSFKMVIKTIEEQKQQREEDHQRHQRERETQMWSEEKTRELHGDLIRDSYRVVR